MTSEPKTRTITLTDRPPVRIREDEWPIIAEASGDSWAGHRGDSRRHQALDQGELDQWWLKVRQHADGRVLVYGVLRAGWMNEPHIDWAGGELLAAASRKDWLGDDVVPAIRRVGEAGGLPDWLIRDCIADLPAEELD